MTYGFIKASWCLSTTRQPYKVPKNNAYDTSWRSSNASHLLSVRWFFFWRSIDARVVFQVTDVNNVFPDFRCICYYLCLTFMGFDFDFIYYKRSACLPFNKTIIVFLLFSVQQEISKRCRLENWDFCNVISGKRRVTTRKNFKAMFLR